MVAAMTVRTREDAATETNNNQSNTQKSDYATHIYTLYLIDHIQYKLNVFTLLSG